MLSTTLDHDHTDKGADDCEEGEDEDDGDLDCPFTGREEVVQWMIFVYEGLSVPSVPMGKNRRAEENEAFGVLGVYHGDDP